LQIEVINLNIIVFKMKYFIAFLLSVFCATSIFAQKESKNVREGNKLYNEKKYSDAQQQYEAGIKKNEKSFSANYNLGNAFYRQNKFKEALEQYSKALTTTKSKNRIASAFHNVGNAFMEQKNYAKSIEAYKKALLANPKDDETRYNLAVAQYLARKQQEQQQNQQDEDEDGIIKRAKELVAQRKYQEAYDLIKSNEKKYPKLKQYADFTERILNVIKINQ